MVVKIDITTKNKYTIIKNRYTTKNTQGEEIMLGMTELYYFSPTGGTEKAGRIFCEGISEKVKEINLCEKKGELEQPESDLVVAAAPVFGGRIPEIVSEKLKKLEGKGKKAVTLVVYGNRAYEDALLELNHVMEGQGFQIIASAALIAQHSIVPEVGQGRPDQADKMEILDFSRKVLEKLDKGIQAVEKVPGNYPYKDGMHVQVPPISLSACSQCRKCENICPTDAIRMEDGVMKTNGEKCILCMACTAACSIHARILPQPLQETMNEKLGALKDIRRENEFYL